MSEFVDLCLSFGARCECIIAPKPSAGGKRMKLTFLDRDPYFSGHIEHRLQLAFPNLDLSLITTADSVDETGSQDLLIYTAEQFPALQLHNEYILRLHSKRPDPKLLSTEILFQEENPEFDLIFRDDPIDRVWSVIEEFVAGYYKESEDRGGITAVCLPAEGRLSDTLSSIVHDRILMSDQLLLIPIMPAYFWPYLTDLTPEQSNLSDLLLELSIRNSIQDVDLSPYLCLSSLGCQTLSSPRRSDDLTLSGPDLFRRLLDLIRRFTEAATPEQWEILLVHYASPLHLAKISFAMANRYYLPDDSTSDPTLLRFTQEVESMYGQIPSGAVPLRLPQCKKGQTRQEPLLREGYYA